MKQILLALTVLGTTYISANAQTESKYAVNSKVCRVDDRYKVCDEDDAAVQITKPNKNTKTEAQLRRLDSYVRVKPTQSVRGQKNAMFTAQYEVPGPSKPEEAAYDGQDSPINDGVEKNKARNINYNTGVEVPPNDGNNSQK